MNKHTAKILTSLLLLLTFIAGQVIVFAHTHPTDTKSVKHYSHNHKSASAEDKCPICVQHGHVQLFLQHHEFHFWSISSSYAPIACPVIYQSIKVLLAGNRGPPTYNLLFA